MKIKTSPHSSAVLSQILFEAASPRPDVEGVYKTSDGWLISERIDRKTFESLLADGTIDPFKVKLGAHGCQAEWKKTRMIVQKAQEAIWAKEGMQNKIHPKKVLWVESTPESSSIFFDIMKYSRDELDKKTGIPEELLGNPDTPSKPWWVAAFEEEQAAATEASKMFSAAVSSQLSTMITPVAGGEPKPTCKTCRHKDECNLTEDVTPCSGFRVEPEPTEPTCQDCANQDERRAPAGSKGITLCLPKAIHVPLAGETCGEFTPVEKTKAKSSTPCLTPTEFFNAIVNNQVSFSEKWSEAAGADGSGHDCTGCIHNEGYCDDDYFEESIFCNLENVSVCGYCGCDKFSDKKPKTLEEKTKTIAETISGLHTKNADLESQKEALKSANEELLELSKNCPECSIYSQVNDRFIEENATLRTQIQNLQAHIQAHIQAEAKENEILKKSLAAAESALKTVEKERDSFLSSGDYFRSKCHGLTIKVEEQALLLKRSKEGYLSVYAASCRVQLTNLSLDNRANAEYLYSCRLRGLMDKEEEK